MRRASRQGRLVVVAVNEIPVQERLLGPRKVEERPLRAA